MQTNGPIFSCRQFTFVVLFAAGCGMTPTPDYSHLDLVDVSGRVTLDGAAFYNARIEFESPDMTSSYGVTNKRGEYRLMYNSEKPGCPPGEKIVRIRLTSTADEAEDPDAPNTRGITIPAQYHTESVLRATVSHDQRVFDFNLKTAGE